MMNLNLKQTNSVITRLNILRRWTSLLTEDKFNELAKQSLNCITAYMIASYCEHEGKTVNWERFPKIALYRAFKKVFVSFDTPEHIIDQVCTVGGIKKSCFDKVTRDLIIENTDEVFGNYICECVGTDEMEIYRAATKIATLVEIFENSAKERDFEVYSEKVLQIQKNLLAFAEMPGVQELSDTNGRMFHLLRTISRLRNQNRWAVHAYQIECSVLGHLFDTAIWAYFIGLEEFGGDEEIASQMFWMGIFHDLAEVWTTDIPSPIKDRIYGFRTATEKYELQVLEENLYSVVPDFLTKKLRAVMLEEEANAGFKKMMKGADYLSADSECWRQYFAGSRDSYFYEAMMRNSKKIADGSVHLTPSCIAIHDYFVGCAEKVCKFN